MQFSLSSPVQTQHDSPILFILTNSFICTSLLVLNTMSSWKNKLSRKEHKNKMLNQEKRKLQCPSQASPAVPTACVDDSCLCAKFREGLRAPSSSGCSTLPIFLGVEFFLFSHAISLVHRDAIFRIWVSFRPGTCKQRKQEDQQR